MDAEEICAELARLLRDGVGGARQRQALNAAEPRPGAGSFRTPSAQRSGDAAAARLQAVYDGVPSAVVERCEA